MAAVVEQTEAAAELRPEITGRNPWALAGRRLRRNRIALAALALFLLIVLACLAAPLYAHYVAHVNPFLPNLNGHTVVDGKVVPVMQQGGGTLHLGETPIGPTWDPHHYFLGADGLGRDVAALLLYGGRSSLVVGIGSAVLCCLIATVVALIAGFFGGAHGLAALPGHGHHLGLPGVPAGDLDIHRAAHPLQRVPVRAGARQRVQPRAAHGHHRVHLPAVRVPADPRPGALGGAQGVRGGSDRRGRGNLRLIFSEILPNVVSTVIVLLPLMIATTILTESALSFLSIGVQPPNVSWGTIINDGQALLYTRPWVSLAPGIMIVLTVLAMNVLGDGVRDALDPRAKLRVEG